MTEKNYTPNQKEGKAMKKQPKAKIIENKPRKEEQEVHANAKHSEEKLRKK